MSSRAVKVLAITVMFLVALILGCGLMLRVWTTPAAENASMGFVERWGSIDLTSFERPSVAEQVNAATWVRAASDMVVLSAEDKRALGPMIQRPAAAWSEDERVRAEALGSRFSEAFATLGRALPLTRSTWDVRYSEGYQAESPDLLAIVWTARLVLLDGRVQLDHGRFSACAERVEMLGRMARSLESESLHIVGLVGAVIERMQLVLAAEMMADPGTPDAALERVEASVLTNDLVATGRRMVRYSVAITVDSWRDVEPDDDAGPFRTFTHSVFTALVARSALSSGNAWMERFEVPFACDPSSFDELDLPWWNLPAQIGSIGHRNTGSWIVRLQSIAALRQRLRAAVALRRVALEAGRYPATAEGMPQVDTPDPLSGRPLRYQLDGGGGATLEIDLEGEEIRRHLADFAVQSLETLMLPPPASS